MPVPGRSFPWEGPLLMCMTGAVMPIVRNPESPSCADVPEAPVSRSVSGSPSGPELCRGLTVVGSHQAHGGYKFSKILVFPESLNLVIGNKYCWLFPWRGRFLVPS